MCNISGVSQAPVQQSSTQQPKAGCGSSCATSSAPTSPAVQQAQNGEAQLGPNPTPEQFKQWFDSLTPARQADAKRFFDYLATHTPEENERFVRFLEGLKSSPAPASPTTEQASPPPGNVQQLGNGVVYPTGNHGSIIGRPHQGTHTLGNWQSDNAIDIGVPEGTPIYATADGVISGTGGNNDNPSSRFNGFKATLDGSGNAWFYTHLSKLVVHDGQQVKAGDLLGYSGSANGVPHLHIGQRDGNPSQTFQV